MNTLQRKIMRRIYYAFFMRVATHPIMLQSALFVLALFVFARMVHVRSVVDNLLATEVASVPSFVASALFHGEVLTLIAIGVMAFTALSVPIRVRSELMPRVRTA